MTLKTKLKVPTESPLDAAFGADPKSLKDNWDFTFIELFAGIGGFRVALDDLGGKCVFASEWNKASQDTYEKNFGERPSGDITKIDPYSIPDHDFLTGGFPCQTFSGSGVTKLISLGREHGLRNPTKGSMFGYTKEIIAAKRPKMFFLENVKGIKNHDKGYTFKIIMDTLNDLDYKVYAAVQTSVYWVPQHRERMFFIGFDQQRVDPNSIDFQFPDPPEPKNGRLPMMADIMESDPDERTRMTDLQWNTLQEYMNRPRKVWGFSYDMNTGTSICRTLMAQCNGSSATLIRDDPNKNPRRPTSRELARLMGFPDSFQVPDRHRAAQFLLGNAVVPPLIRHVTKAMLQTWDQATPNLAPLDLSEIQNNPIIPPPKQENQVVQKVSIPEPAWDFFE